MEFSSHLFFFNLLWLKKGRNLDSSYASDFSGTCTLVSCLAI